MKADSILFSPGTKADVNRLAALEIDLFHTDRCSRKSLRHMVERSQVIVARVKETKEIVGYAILLGRKNSRKMRIYSFGIVAKAQHLGIGGRMIQHLEAMAIHRRGRMLTLEVSDGNTAAINLYTKHGFEQYGFRLGYYEDGGHAILMRKRLSEELAYNDHTLDKGSQN